MKKVVVVLAGLGAVGMLALWRVPPLLAPAHDASPAAEAAPIPVTKEASARIESSAQAETKDDPAKVTPQESDVLAMYEELVDRIDRPELPCKRFEADFVETISKHEPALKALNDAQAALPERERDAARARLEHAARHQLARLRQSLRSGFARCPPSEGMKTELTKLAANNAM
jgi:hypothetical protein